MGVGLVVAVITTFAAAHGTPPGSAETKVFHWLNDPEAVLGAVLAITAPLLRPIPLAVIIGVAVVLVAITHRRAALPILASAALAGLLAYVLDHVLKALADRGRPPAYLADVLTHGYPVEPRGSGFPSSHTAVSVAVVVGIWPFLPRVWRIVAVVVVVLIGLDRIYVGAHLPLDVLGGAAVGLMAGGAVVAAGQVWRRVRRSRPKTSPAS
jgi:undecaprenyl-diphosphatase